MKCPKCEKQSVCFCGNCKSRRNMPKQRSERVVKPQHLKCPVLQRSIRYRLFGAVSIRRVRSNTNHQLTINGMFGDKK